MKKQTIFEGIGTAIITPLNKNGVDFEKLAEHIETQIARGVDAIIVCGTTGEKSTLSDAEHKSVIKFTVETVAGRLPVVAGTGSNDFEHTLKLSEYSESVGADGLLIVTPYYNKATQKGVVKFYTAVADSVTIPIIVYNVPSRTGLNILPETYAELAKHERIVAIKEANGNISSIAETLSMCGDKIAVYSGNDDQLVPVLSLGGIGCISVLSNILPEKTRAVYTYFKNGNIEESARLQLELTPLIKALFSEVNPIPIKAACAAMGICENFLRLPLTQLEPKHEEELYSLMRKEGLI